MPFTKIMIHAVWGTKNRFPFLAEEKLQIMINQIKDNAKIKG